MYIYHHFLGRRSGQYISTHRQVKRYQGRYLGFCVQNQPRVQLSQPLEDCGPPTSLKNSSQPQFARFSRFLISGNTEDIN